VNLKSKLSPRLQKYASFGLIPKLLLFPVALIILLLIIVVRPVLRVYIYKIDWPFGHFFVMPHFAAHSHHLWNLNHRRKKLGIYCLTTKTVSNQFVYNKFKKNCLIFRNNLGWLLVLFADRIDFVKGKSSIIDFHGRNLKSPSTNIIRGDSLIKFTESEIRVYNKFLSDICDKDNKRFVCLNIRDDLYNRSISLIKKEYPTRDSRAETYIAAAEKLAKIGYTVFRMGAVVKDPLVSTHPRVIDYATNGMRTEFHDVLLGATCSFAVSVGSGWDAVPAIFRRPMMWVNHLPIFDASGLTLPITIYPKLLVDQNSGNMIIISEILERGVANTFKPGAYKDAGVQIRDLSSEELVDAVTEMAQRVEGTFVETPEQKEMQAKLKHILSTHPKLQPSPNYYPIRAQFASCFLSRYPNFLDGLD
jgi:putative glycosyltransferase (TIGR04372 family)